MGGVVAGRDAEAAAAGEDEVEGAAGAFGVRRARTWTGRKVTGSG